MSNQASSESVTEPKNLTVELLLRTPRAPLSRLTKKGFASKTLTQQRLIIVLEQIGYLKGMSSQRDLAHLLGIGQASIQNYLGGEISDPLSMRSSNLKAIAKQRGVTELTLRKFLSGDADTEEEDDIDANTFLEMAQTVPLSILLEVLPIARDRVLAEMGERGLLSIARSLQELPEKPAFRNGVQSQGKKELEIQPEPEPKPEPEPQPHPGNLLLLDMLKEKQEELAFDDERFAQYCSLFLRDEMSPEELLEELQESIDPIPNKLLSGALSKILAVPSEVLYRVRDELEPVDKKMDRNGKEKKRGRSYSNLSSSTSTSNPHVELARPEIHPADLPTSRQKLGKARK